MSGSAAARADRRMGCSPVMTLRLLAMAEDVGHDIVIDEPEQLVLPLEWAWSIPRRVAPTIAAPSARPDPRHWGGRVTLAAFEIMLGTRPASQLARLMDARTLQTLALQSSNYSVQRKKAGRVLQGRPKLTSVHCYQPHPDAAEVTAVIHDGFRFRAVALRLNARGNQWVATAFETR